MCVCHASRSCHIYLFHTSYGHHPPSVMYTHTYLGLQPQREGLRLRGDQRGGGAVREEGGVGGGVRAVGLCVGWFGCLEGKMLGGQWWDRAHHAPFSLLPSFHPSSLRPYHTRHKTLYTTATHTRSAYTWTDLHEGGLELCEGVGGGVALDPVLRRVPIHGDDLVLSCGRKRAIVLHD